MEAAAGSPPKVDYGTPNFFIGPCMIIITNVILIVILLPKYHKKIWSSMRDWQTIKAFVFPMAVMLACFMVYMCGSYGTDYNYLKYSFERDDFFMNPSNALHGRLSDFLLDRVEKVDDTILGPIYDAVPGVLIFAACLMCLIMNYPEELNYMLLSIGTLLICNFFIENATVLPSSFGWGYCKERYYSGLTKAEDFPFMPTPFGGCASMMWSGHTVHTLIGAFFFLSVLELEFPRVGRVLKMEYLGISIKMWLTWTMGLIEAVMLIFGHGHYTVDILVSFTVVTLFLANDKYRYYCTRFNPFLKTLNRPKTFYENALINQEMVQKLQERYPEIASLLSGEDERLKDKTPEEQSVQPQNQPEEMLAIAG